MAGRKKTQFTDEMNQLIKDSIFEGKNLQEIVDELMNEFGLKTSIPAITRHIKSLGIERPNNKRGVKGEDEWEKSFFSGEGYEDDGEKVEYNEVAEAPCVQKHKIHKDDNTIRFYDFCTIPYMVNEDKENETWYDRNGILKIKKTSVSFIIDDELYNISGMRKGEFEMQSNYEFITFKNKPNELDEEDMHRWYMNNSNGLGEEVGKKIYKLRKSLSETYDMFREEINSLYDDIIECWQVGLGASEDLSRFNELCHTIWIEYLKYGYESGKLLGVGCVPAGLIKMEDEESQRYILGDNYENKLDKYSTTFMKYMNEACGEGWDKDGSEGATGEPMQDEYYYGDLPENL